jgi:hypothetical protein
MKRIAFVVLSCALLIGSASAYYIAIDAPEQLQVGLPLVVTGSTSVPPATMVIVYLSYNPSFSEQVDQKRVYVLGDQKFRVVFDTTGLKTGQYKVEVGTRPDFFFGSASTTARTVQLVNRLDELSMDSAMSQIFSGTLNVTGKIRTLKNQAVQVVATASDGTLVFGPKYIPTKADGGFSFLIPVPSVDNYDVSFTDTKGYIGFVTFTVHSANEVQAATLAPTPEPVISSASALSLPDKPAYFEVKKRDGNSMIFTSARVDWVIEYNDEFGVIHSINNKGSEYPEEVMITGPKRTIYVRVFPSSFLESGIVTLSAENADSVQALTTVAGPFTAGSELPLPTRTPLFAPLAGIALAAAVILRRR